MHPICRAFVYALLTVAVVITVNKVYNICLERAHDNKLREINGHYNDVQIQIGLEQEKWDFATRVVAAIFVTDPILNPYISAKYHKLVKQYKFVEDEEVKELKEVEREGEI